MKVDVTSITQNIADYKATLNDPNSKYWVFPQTAEKLVNDLENAILELGNNYKNGTQVCPYSNLGQRKGRDGYAVRRNLRMKKFGNWIIVFAVYPKKGEILVKKLVHQGYPLGDSIRLRDGDGLSFSFESKNHNIPIIECLHWMLKLGCMNEEQVISASKQLLL